jgi:ParB family chromosome partitioning protein
MDATSAFASATTTASRKDDSVSFGTSTLIEVPCASIRVPERYRKDLGDLDGLAQSIQQDGPLQPVGISKDDTGANDYVLRYGARRLSATRDTLQRSMITALLVPSADPLRAEYAENEYRKDLTPSEKVEIGKAVEKMLHNGDVVAAENFPAVPGSETRRIAAKRAGFGNERTYAQARQVTERAIPEVVDKMDSGELAIDAAHMISQEQPDEQRKIASMPKTEMREAVRVLREKRRSSGRHRRPSVSDAAAPSPSGATSAATAGPTYEPAGKAEDAAASAASFTGAVSEMAVISTAETGDAEPTAPQPGHYAEIVLAICRVVREIGKDNRRKVAEQVARLLAEHGNAPEIANLSAGCYQAAGFLNDIYLISDRLAKPKVESA